MSLVNELGLTKPFINKAHETLLNIVLTGSLLMKEGHKVLEPFGITEAQFNILMLLKHHCPDGHINQTELGRMLLVNRSNVTGLIDRMEQANLVRRLPDSDDRRVHQIEMTENGAEILEKSERVYYRRIEEIMSQLTSDQLDSLIDRLETLRSFII